MRRSLFFSAIMMLSQAVSAADLVESSYYKCFDALDQADRFRKYSFDIIGDSDKEEAVLKTANIIDSTSATAATVFRNTDGFGFDERLHDQLNSQRPYAVLASQVENGKTYLYSLTREGFRRVSVEKPEKGTVVVVRRLSEANAQAMPYAECLKVSTKIEFDAVAQIAADGDCSLDPVAVAKKTGRPLANIDYSKTPLLDGDVEKAKALYREKIKEMISIATTAQDAQMKFVSTMSPKYIANLTAKTSFTKEQLAAGLTKRLNGAMDTCGALSVGVESETHDAIIKMNAALARVVPASGGPTQVPVAPGTTNSKSVH